MELEISMTKGRGKVRCTVDEKKDNVTSWQKELDSFGLLIWYIAVQIKIAYSEL